MPGVNFGHKIHRFLSDGFLDETPDQKELKDASDVSGESSQGFIPALDTRVSKDGCPTRSIPFEFDLVGGG